MYISKLREERSCISITNVFREDREGRNTMKRLTHPRDKGIKTGYWSLNKKDELIEQLAAYEDTGLTPEEVEQLKERYMLGKKVHSQGDDESDGIECPFCGYEVARNDDYDSMKPKYCPECGTKLLY